jgi:hypothetical protein
MQIRILLADFPAGMLTGIFTFCLPIGLALFCLFVAWTLKGAENRRAVRGWRIAAGVFVFIGVLSIIIMSLVRTRLP